MARPGWRERIEETVDPEQGIDCALELVLNMLAEATTTEISKERKPRTTAANRAVAAQGGRIAGNTRREIEAQTGKRIVSPLTAKQALAEKTAEGIEHPEADTTE